MNVESFRDYCILKAGVTESFPFNETTLVFKVMNKMFALADIELFEGINLKCDPDKALELRERFEGIKPGYHMSKKHWNTVSTDGSITDKMILELIDESYALIVASLPKSLQNELEGHEG